MSEAGQDSGSGRSNREWFALLLPISLVLPLLGGDPQIPRPPITAAGAIQGQVRDEHGSPVPFVQMTLVALGGERTYRTVSTGEGIFRFFGLVPGGYELRGECEGMRPLIQRPIVVMAGEVKTLILTVESDRAAPRRTTRLPRRPTKEIEGTVEEGAREEPGEERTALESRLPPRPERKMREITETGPREPPPVPFTTPRDPPLGAAGPSPIKRGEPTGPDSVAEPDRWRVGFPSWNRGTGYEAPYTHGRWWDPFNQNILKGDYPLFGQHVFFTFTATSETVVEGRRLYVPSNVSAADPLSEPFFGRGGQFFLNQNFILSATLFHGDTAFKPVDWQVKVTPVINLNYLATRETGLVNIDVRRGTTRFDSHFAFQELFGEVKLADVSPKYDFVSLRVGIQPFISDFRGFVFVDNQPGIRFFGNWASNLYQWNVAAFTLLEKDTNSRLNTVFESRHQYVVIANLYRQDFIKRGYTIQGSIHYSDDHAGRSDENGLHFDRNGFLVRPAAIGSFTPHNLKIGYLGMAGDGHIGRLNISHAFYQALGQDDRNPIAGRPIRVNAQMIAAELSVDRDWLRLKGSFFFSSGDSRPLDDRGRGFDSIIDAPNFAGGIFGFFNRQGIRLTGTNVVLVDRESLLPSLRSSKDEGQANFVNPGLFLFHIGADAELTPKLRGFANVSVLRFHRTEPLELVLFQAPIRHGIGVDYGLGVLYRPPLTENIVITAGASALTPFAGFRDIFTSKTLLSTFAAVRLTF